MNPNRYSSRPVNPSYSPAPNLYSNGYSAPANSPSVVAPTQPAPTLPTFSKESPVKTILIVVLSLVSVAFIGLFIWMFTKWSDASADVESQIKSAVAVAVNEEATRLEDEFAEREKTPYSTFSGPENYGNLSFSYPRTWSLYVERDASSGGNYTAYLNPSAVGPVSSDAVFALRVDINSNTFERNISSYDSLVDRGDMKMSVVSINGGKSTANVYRGTLPSDNHGAVAIFAIRDKTVILQTDSTYVFGADFDRILSVLTFNN
ncbi:hypothetical protein IJI02_00825 [Candidatus Saccharibacteria bacterium]|nr:hypothetical protein [Candidatus Saccharibacteria bacterium]